MLNWIGCSCILNTYIYMQKKIHQALTHRLTIQVLIADDAPRLILQHCSHGCGALTLFFFNVGKASSHVLLTFTQMVKLVIWELLNLCRTYLKAATISQCT